MKVFADLYMQLDATTGSTAKLEAMQAYFRDADPADAAWAVYFLAGGRPRQLVCIKLITGSFRVGVSKLLVARAVSALSGVDAKRIAQRLVGYTDLSARPVANTYLRLIAAGDANGCDSAESLDPGHPYP